MSNKKVRMVVEFELDEETIKEKGITAEEVVEAIQFHNHDTIDGFEIFPQVDGCDLCSDFFLSNPSLISKELVEDEPSTEALKEHLNNLMHELDGAAAHDPDAVPAIEAAIGDALNELGKALKERLNNQMHELDGAAAHDPACGIADGVDAVFLPGKIHGCEDELYIIYYNASANDEKGCFEIEIVDYERILSLYEDVNGDAEQFFAILPDLFHGEWCYCNSDEEEFAGYAEDYFNADFICGRDGGFEEKLAFMVKWAREREDYYRAQSLAKRTFADIKVGDVVIVFDEYSHDYIEHRVKVESIEYDKENVCDDNPDGKICFGTDLDEEEWGDDYISTVTCSNFCKVADETSAS